MSNKLFTDEEVEILRSNPYTYAVSNKQIAYTREFKDLFWKRHTMGVGSYQIFKDAGYDPKMIGKSRICGFAHTLKETDGNGQEFYEGRMPKGAKMAAMDSDVVSKKDFRTLQHEVEYLRQEVDFLKKIASLKNSKK